MLPKAPKAVLRPTHSRSRSASSSATRTSVAPVSHSAAATSSLTSATSSSSPSSSTSSTAPASLGYPASVTFCTARMLKASIISSAAGTMPCPMTADTAVHAASISENIPRKVRTDSGSGSSRTSILVAIPKVPSEPTKAPRRSYPALSRARLPRLTTVPSSSATSMPMT